MDESDDPPSKNRDVGATRVTIRNLGLFVASPDKNFFVTKISGKQ